MSAYISDHCARWSPNIRATLVFGQRYKIDGHRCLFLEWGLSLLMRGSSNILASTQVFSQPRQFEMIVEFSAPWEGIIPSGELEADLKVRGLDQTVARQACCYHLYCLYRPRSFPSSTCATMRRVRYIVSKNYNSAFYGVVDICQLKTETKLTDVNNQQKNSDQPERRAQRWVGLPEVSPIPAQAPPLPPSHRPGSGDSMQKKI